MGIATLNRILQKRMLAYPVGWVERSDTHHTILPGITVLNPSYV
jgi:hypothetical protein